MFGSSERPNPLEPAVTKATSEELTSENWEHILDVCDKVNDDPENGAVNAVKALTKRLQTKNANVQLYTLTLANSLAQNCGSKMQRELATKSFTQQLLSLGQDKAVHNSVKSKLAETMADMAREFKSDPSLRQMEEAYNTLRQKTHIQAPAKPQKQQMTDADKQKEEDELQMVLALSLSEAELNQKPKSDPTPPGPSHESQFEPSYDEQLANKAADGESKQTQQPGKTAATVKRVRALYDLNSTEEGELSFRKGDVIHVIESVYRDWWRGTLRGQVGIFPLNYVMPMPEPTAQDLQREAQDELSVFAQSKNIEKLLAILSSADSQQDSLRIAENEQLQNLYHSTLAVRPKLVKLIDKYSQKKEDLIALNEKFISARRTYDELMENSLAQYRVSSASPRQSYSMPHPHQPPYPVSGPNGNPNPAPFNSFPPQENRQGSSAAPSHPGASHYSPAPSNPYSAPPTSYAPPPGPPLSAAPPSQPSPPDYPPPPSAPYSAPSHPPPPPSNPPPSQSPQFNRTSSPPQQAFSPQQQQQQPYRYQPNAAPPPVPNSNAPPAPPAANLGSRPSIPSSFQPPQPPVQQQQQPLQRQDTVSSMYSNYDESGHPPPRFNDHNTAATAPAQPYSGY